MAAYVDDAAIMWRGKLRYHMAADSLEELHSFAQSIGVKRCWYHAHPRRPHYDITGPQREDAFKAGAQLVDARTMVLKTTQLRQLP